jgi:hypothetical protein
MYCALGKAAPCPYRKPAFNLRPGHGSALPLQETRIYFSNCITVPVKRAPPIVTRLAKSAE